MVLEVMGRDAGHIALAMDISGGADVILIPEIGYLIEGIATKIRSLRERGRNFALVAVAEAVKTVDGDTVTVAGGESHLGGIGHYLGDRIAEATEAETRVTVLGHTQRGGAPAPRDRLFARAFGVHAVDLIAEGRFDRMVEPAMLQCAAAGCNRRVSGRRFCRNAGQHRPRTRHLYRRLNS